MDADGASRATSRASALSASGLGGTVFRVGPPKLEELPDDVRARFVASRERASKPHPLYKTSSGEYGRVPRGVVLNLVQPVAGKKGGFSQTFTSGGAVRSQSLITSVARSKFHSALD